MPIEELYIMLGTSALKAANQSKSKAARVSLLDEAIQRLKDAVGNLEGVRGRWQEELDFIYQE